MSEVSEGCDEPKTATWFFDLKGWVKILRMHRNAVLFKLIKRARREKRAKPSTADRYWRILSEAAFASEVVPQGLW